jgi:uncharacterized membrane protein YjjP (DUF1212 family)
MKTLENILNEFIETIDNEFDLNVYHEIQTISNRIYDACYELTENKTKVTDISNIRVLEYVIEDNKIET